MLAALLAGHSAMLCFVWICGAHLSRMMSLVVMACGGLLSLSVISVLYVRRYYGLQTIAILLAAYIAKVGVGVWHYLAFLDSEYFSGVSAYDYLWDFKWMDVSLIFVSNYWRDYGFGLLPESYFLETKNAFLLAYSAISYFLGGDNALNIAPWNAVHSVYVAIIIGALCIQNDVRKKSAMFAVALVSFQPFGFISSMMWRDSVGQLFLVLAVFLILAVRRRKYLMIIVLPFACFLAWSQREPYLIAVFALGMYVVYLSYKKKMHGFVALLIIGLALIGVNLLQSIIDLSFMRASSQSSINVLLFPLRLLRALMGPFPWYQVFLGVDGWIYMPIDFVQTVYNIAIYILAIPLAFAAWKRNSSVNPVFFIWALLFATGIQAIGVHQGYISIGVVFLVPLIKDIKVGRYASVFFGCFGVFVSMNLLYWMLGLTGSGVLMGITGY